MVLFALLALAGCMAALSPEEQAAPQAAKPAGSEELVVAGGCFWCLEPLFERLKGVYAVEVGYAGGNSAKTTYEEVCTGLTGHAEALKLTYDPKVITADDLLRIFFTIHDPTTLNRQGPDEGPQYRSAVFYRTDEEKQRAQAIIDEITKERIWKGRIVTTLEPLKNYSRAEEYHQDYYEKFQKAGPLEKMGMNAGYCRVVIDPKVTKFRQKFSHLMK
ncbi:MAG TPA: peptide-methionine (S)-S-oxide reductase MsrA [Fimbriimonas sp.]